MSIDLKPVVKETYPYIIKGCLDRIMLFEIDTIMNFLVHLHTADPQDKDELMLTSDKFFVYKHLWKGVLETLYEKYLPHLNYNFNWNIEVTPYTMMLCEMSKEHHENTEIEVLKKLTNLNDEDIEKNFDQLAKDAGFDKMGIKDGLKEYVPQSLRPASKKEELSLIFRLMNFPPLGELSLFQNLYQSHLRKQFKQLSIAFPGISEDMAPSFGMPEYLGSSWFHIDHVTFQKYGLDTFEKIPELSGFKSDFEVIRTKADSHKETFKDQRICPCCGEKQEITLPEHILQYKFLLENQKLAIAIGFYYIEEFTENYKKSLVEKFYSYLPNINKVDNPKCIILVEGESEEASLPLLAFRKRFVLSQHNIQVYNSKSKQKLAADFLAMKANYPNRKIICLLDSDAIRERDDIQRIVNDHKDKYRVVFINDGTFEDLFDLELSINILNELYPEGEAIIMSDFDGSKDFLSNIKGLLFQKKKAQFDKVLFAKTISMRIDIENLPKEIQEIFEIAQDFSAPNKFIK